MSNINVTLSLSVEMVYKLEKITESKGKEFNDFIIEELDKIINKKPNLEKNTKNLSSILEKYRSM